MLLNRRRVLTGLGAGLLFSYRLKQLSAAAPHNLDKTPEFDASPFQLGVASGDPAPDGFVIWTRLAPHPLEEAGGMKRLKPVLVDWEISEDERFSTRLRSGQTIAHPELAHSVHVEVDGPQPDRPYWYRFHIAGHESPIGRARTLPLPGASVQRVRFAAAGCQHYEFGYYSAWRAIANENVDFVFHYGDYIYEDPDIGAGVHTVYGKPFTAVRTPADIFRLRRASAMQAYYEHMPLRISSLPDGSHMQMYRSFRFGDLMNTFVLDTRQYRSDQAYGDKDVPQGTDVWSPERTMMGQQQEAWLFNGLGQSDTRWNLLAHQVMVMDLAHRKSAHSELLYSMDQWSGYMHSRNRLLQFIGEDCPGNVVNVTGDAHRHYAGNLVIDPAKQKPVSVEFLATSISSGGDGVGDNDAHSQSVRRENPHLKATTDKRGYVLCDVGRDVWRADLKTLDQVSNHDGQLSTYASFAVERGNPGLQKA